MTTFGIGQSSEKDNPYFSKKELEESWFIYFQFILTKKVNTMQKKKKKKKTDVICLSSYDWEYFQRLTSLIAQYSTPSAKSCQNTFIFCLLIAFSQVLNKMLLLY